MVASGSARGARSSRAPAAGSAALSASCFLNSDCTSWRLALSTCLALCTMAPKERRSGRLQMGNSTSMGSSANQAGLVVLPHTWVRLTVVPHRTTQYGSLPPSASATGRPWAW